MRITVKHNGKSEDMELPAQPQPFTCLVHQTGMKVQAKDAYTISPKDTIKCMEEMSQAAWLHISTGPLFKHLFYECLFKDQGVTLPREISSLIEDYDEGTVHGCGLIVLLAEAYMEGKKEVYSLPRDVPAPTDPTLHRDHDYGGTETTWWWPRAYVHTGPRLSLMDG